ncbi:hypothetical protein B0T10DRAFT_562570 [Thelonectria olida]|uniref:RRM domain-containing protein n=1 Tax=Thelonectria olida TaxID=1576542 RepID=A0A9P8W5Z7_9HYPO|nr:hypothetical protein B0T10DRAFT_562570 [Thelonectria olida]
MAHNLACSAISMCACRRERGACDCDFYANLHRKGPLPSPFGASGAMAQSAQYPIGMVPRTTQIPPRLATEPYPFDSPKPPSFRVMIDRLPVGVTEESLRAALEWPKNLSVRFHPITWDQEAVPPGEQYRYDSYSVVLTFESKSDAVDAHGTLAYHFSRLGYPETDVIVDFSESDHTSSPASSASSGPRQRQPSQATMLPNPATDYGQNYPMPVDNLQLEIPGASGNSYTSTIDNGLHLDMQMMSISPQNMDTPHSNSQRNIGKSLIGNDCADDETKLLSEPWAYTANAPPLLPSSQSQYTSPSSVQSTPLSPRNGTSPVMTYPMGNQRHQRSYRHPPANHHDRNPPINTLYIGNLPLDTSEEELKALFSRQRGYKRLSLRPKANGPMGFVEFEDVTWATKALRDLYGTVLSTSKGDGIRLSFSKNPLGVRPDRAPGGAPGQNHPGTYGPRNGLDNTYPRPTHHLSAATGPPPGLSYPPGYPPLGPVYPNHASYMPYDSRGLPLPAPRYDNSYNMRRRDVSGNYATSYTYPQPIGNGNGHHSALYQAGTPFPQPRRDRNGNNSAANQMGTSYPQPKGSTSVIPRRDENGSHSAVNELGIPNPQTKGSGYPHFLQG